MSTPYIQFKDVYYTANKTDILSGLDFNINKSEFVALVGDNGCGKTTLTKLLIGVIKADKGEIMLDGVDVKKYKLHEVGAKIGYVFQNANYQIFAPTVEEELSFAMRYKGIDEQTIKSRIEEMIDRFALGETKDVTTYNLSQGEKQRLAIACMLINEPEFIVLDEPTVGLDEQRKNQLMEYLKEINSQDIGILVISHDRKMVQNYAKRIVQMKGGKLYENI